MEEMTALVVKYLKDRYSARWKELTAQATEHRQTSENPKISRRRARSL